MKCEFKKEKERGRVNAVSWLKHISSVNTCHQLKNHHINPKHKLLQSLLKLQSI